MAETPMRACAYIPHFALLVSKRSNQTEQTNTPLRYGPSKEEKKQSLRLREERNDSVWLCLISRSRAFVQLDLKKASNFDMSWRPMLLPHLASGFCRFYSKSSPYLVKVGIPEFLSGIGKGVEAHVGKIETEIGDFQKLLATRTLKLKKLGIPCKQRKLILKYSQKYRLGLWRPRAEPVKS